MLHRTEGIILRSSPYGEADLIVTCLTKDYGIVKVFAKSPRKVKSRFGSSLEPLTRCHISFWGKEDSLLPRLTQADIITTHDKLRESIDVFVQIVEIIELTLHLIPERDTSKCVYDMLLETLSLMLDDHNDPIIPLAYKLRLLEVTGFLPNLRSCGRCGNSGEAFHLSHGTVLCERCCSDESQISRISAGAQTFFDSLLRWEPSKLKRLKPRESLVRELRMLLDEHAQYISDRQIKARGFRRRSP